MLPAIVRQNPAHVSKRVALVGAQSGMEAACTEDAGAEQIRDRRCCKGFSDAHPPCQRDTNHTAPDHYHQYLEHRSPTVPMLQEKVYRRNFTLE